MKNFLRAAFFLLAVPAVYLFMAGHILAQPLPGSLHPPTNGIFRGKNQILTLKGEIAGGEFRVTTVLPFRGDFSRYRRIEVARVRSLVGNDLLQRILDRYDQKVVREFRRQFRRAGIFNNVVLTDEYQPPDPPSGTSFVQNSTGSASLNGAGAEGASAGGRGPSPGGYRAGQLASLRADDRSSGPKEEERPPTLVIVGEVLNYTAGNSFLQLIPLNLGSADFTVRYRYYDKETGLEVGREVIAGEVSATSLFGAFHRGAAISRVAEGLVDQITRRTLAGER